MAKGILEKMGPFAKLIFAAFIVIACFLLTLLGGLFLAMPIFGMGFMEMFDSLSNIAHPGYPGLLKYFQIIQSIGLFIVPSFILAWFFGGNSLKYLLLDRPISWHTLLLTAAIMISAIPLVNLMAHFNAGISLPDAFSALEQWMQRTEESAKRITELFLRADTTTDLLFNLMLIAVIPAIGEELLFRGVVQRLFSEWTRNRHLGIWLAAIIFSAMHIQFYGFLPRTMLGVLFGYLLIWSGRMWVPVTAHFVNNAAAVLVYYFIQRNQISPTVETIGSEPRDWIYVVVSMVILLSFLLLFYLKVKRPPGH
jgi:uncharacterized protein